MLEQLEAPALDVWPKEQEEQPVAPKLDEYVPAAQLMQLEAPEPEYVPGLHEEQDAEEPPEEYVPGEQV